MRTADRIFWFSVPAKVDSNYYFCNFFLEIFYFKNGDGQTARCVVGKTMLYREFGYKAVGRGPRFSAAGGNAKWACLNLLRIALTILKKQVNNVNDNERLSTSCLFGAAADIIRQCWLRLGGLKLQSRFTNTPRIRIK